MAYERNKMNLSDFGWQADTLAKEVAQIDLRKPSLTENIDRQIGDNEKRLAELLEMKELLTKNPEFERMLTLLGGGMLRGY